MICIIETRIIRGSMSVITVREMRSTYKILIEKPQRLGPLVIPEREWDDILFFHNAVDSSVYSVEW
jgi:hypothetical protein